MNNTTGVTAPAELLKAQKLANRLDTAFKLPFIPFRIGLDAIIGLIPGLGDAVMLIAALRIVYLGKRMGLPPGLVKVMLRNALLDFGLGFIPLVGDIVDFFYKANQANVRVMEKYWVSQNKDAIDANAKSALEAWSAKQQ
ncbi:MULTISPECIES: DUF4112 domain-containing protein [Marisediminitalea]|jgi:hypothetical protein|uniref:DUF4112 domain-containing protein n=1 Tax=Marisediminitalea TaxID=2662254 RepID=UPI0020CF2B95|nr:DUF4112 domain-containing protein [Marisediminitalea aggregata]MCP3862067.1 DUF4112 domain-containing protein [Aestuariibacter sp.]MCP4528261.1 DUF4112 domain-containing protein [Aestuariibacter sp.]MCP4946306.1 DUF4112 domain-containing protein [Aestuariibacter sp.]MCP9477361.1 DUF4112 domain-containing protein [Marisediminitalea aggregata]